jgi:hypothetical protein
MRNFLTCTRNFHTPRPRSSLTDHPTCDRALTGLLLPLAQTAKQIVSLGESPLSPSTFRPFLVHLLAACSMFRGLANGLTGTRFWIRYNIEEWATTNCQWYFFKLFMNGRQVTSWGTNARTNPSGQIMKGLFDPSELWNYDHNGTMYKNMGLEERSFVFAFEDKDNKPSAAMDGGLIEVKVYRARGRSRMMPTPLEFKSQDGYGIV